MNESSAIRFGVEEAVRLGLTAFAPDVIAQLAEVSAEEAERGLFDFQLAHPYELTGYSYAVCPNCRAQAQSAAGHHTAAGDRVNCICGERFVASESNIHWMYEPRGALAVPVERWHEVKPTPRSRLSTLAERAGGLYA